MRKLPLKLTATLAVFGAAVLVTPTSTAAPAPGGEAQARSIPSVGITVQPDGTTTLLPVAGAAAHTSSVGRDPDLEPGFPVSTYGYGGTYHAGPAINVLVGDLDRDRTLELCATALAVGPVSCWGHDGTPVEGWEPTRQPTGAGYFTMGTMRPLRGPTVVTAVWGGEITAENRAGNVRPGWPIMGSNYISSPPSMGLFGRKQSAVVLGEEDWRLHAYLADADVAPGWPTGGLDGGQERHTPAITDVDGERGREVVSASGWISGYIDLFVDHVDGTSVEGYPVAFTGEADTYPAVGDVDDDGVKEIVVVGTDPADTAWSAVYVYEAATGRLEGMRRLSGGVPYGTAPALAQLDGACGAEGGLLEIVVQTEPTIEVITWDGTTFRNRAGFPKTWNASQWIGDSSPVVGDVDGDQSPDIVFTGQYAGQGVDGSVYAYSASGSALSGFPKQVEIGSGGMPAIADVDRDGRNEIAIKGSPWDGYEGPKATLWLYDLGGSDHGRIEWGQFMHDAAHRGAYVTPRCPAS